MQNKQEIWIELYCVHTKFYIKDRIIELENTQGRNILTNNMGWSSQIAIYMLLFIVLFCLCHSVCGQPPREIPIVAQFGILVTLNAGGTGNNLM